MSTQRLVGKYWTKTWRGLEDVLPGGDEVLVEDVQDVLADVSQLLLHLDGDSFVKKYSATQGLL